MGKSIAVLGVGRFGRTLALELSREGAEVLAVDRDDLIIEKIADDVTCAIAAELSDEDAIRKLGLEEMDAVVISMGSDLQASIISIMVAREQGVPYIVAKASSKRMGAILTKIGADHVIYPEEEAGLRCAKTLLTDAIHDVLEIDADLCILRILPFKEWIGKRLGQLDLRKHYGINVIAMRKQDQTDTRINSDTVIPDDSELFVLVNKEDIYKIR